MNHCPSSHCPDDYSPDYSNILGKKCNMGRRSPCQLESFGPQHSTQKWGVYGNNAEIVNNSSRGRDNCEVSLLKARVLVDSD